MTSAECSYCGWVRREPSPLQAAQALTHHQAYDCKNHRLCAVCTEMARGRERILDKGKPAVFVCDRCAEEHPRAGNYAFDHGREVSRVSSGRKGPKK